MRQSAVSMDLDRAVRALGETRHLRGNRMMAVSKALSIRIPGVSEAEAASQATSTLSATNVPSQPIIPLLTVYCQLTKKIPE